MMLPHTLMSRRPKFYFRGRRLLPVFFRNSYSPTMTSSTYLHTSPTTFTLNCYGVDLLPTNLQSKLFKSVKTTTVTPTSALEASSELKKFGLISSGSSFPLPDITPHLPTILNSNVSDHFWQVASRQVQPYTDLLAADTPRTQIRLDQVQC